MRFWLFGDLKAGPARLELLSLAGSDPLLRSPDRARLRLQVVNLRLAERRADFLELLDQIDVSILRGVAVFRSLDGRVGLGRAHYGRSQLLRAGGRLLRPHSVRRLGRLPPSRSGGKCLSHVGWIVIHRLPENFW